MSATTLAKMQSLSIGDLAHLPPECLFELKAQAADQLAAAKQVCDRLDQALERRYAEPAQILRRAQGKDTGVVHFDDGTVRITADLPKKVEWDQTQLAAIVQNIAASGDNPAEYVELAYKVSETKFNAWPESIKTVFLPARTLKTGKPGFRLALIHPEGP